MARFHPSNLLEVNPLVYVSCSFGDESLCTHPIRPIIKAIYLYDNVSIRTLSMTSSTGCVLGLEDVLST